MSSYLKLTTLLSHKFQVYCAKISVYRYLLRFYIPLLEFK